MAEHNVAVVLAAGKGSRMNSDMPKQYMDLAGKPVIYYSMKAFEDCEDISEIILVSGQGDEDYCRTDIVERYGFNKVSHIIAGGKERYDSVYAALNAIEECDYVLIHDGARPMLDGEMLKRNLECVRESGACISAVPCKDTIKLCDAEGNVLSTPDRSNLWNVQTPQSFRYSLILDAFRKLYLTDRTGITDDAMVVEKMTGTVVKTAMGDYRNIKITTPEDLIVANAFLEARKKP